MQHQNNQRYAARRQFIKKSAAGLLGMLSYPGLVVADTSLEIPDTWHAADDDRVFALVRKQLLLDKKLVYMNTGSLGPSPRLVVDKVNEVVHQLERNPVTENWGPLGKEMAAVREKAARFINAGVDEIVLTRNTTEGLSMVGATLTLSKGDEILTTNHEHGGAEVGLNYLAGKYGAVVKKVEMPLPARSKQQVVELITSHITRKTRVLLLSHVVTITGLRMPIAEIAEAIKNRDILFVVDGAQAPGMLAVDVKQLGADVYATSGHKWLLGPKETGIVYIRKEVQDKIKPVFTASGYNAYSASSGTRNVATIIGLGEALEWHELIGRQRIETRVLDLAAYCRQQLLAIPGLKVISPEARELASALVSAQLLQASNRDVYQALKREDIIVKVLPQHNALRFSNHMFNTREDVDKAIAGLQKVLNQ